jgi:hypothetical protein
LLYFIHLQRHYNTSKQRSRALTCSSFHYTSFIEFLQGGLEHLYAVDQTFCLLKTTPLLPRLLVLQAQVPIVCMGTMTFGEQNSEEESFAIMDYALSQGVNFLDTAEL